MINSFKIVDGVQIEENCLIYEGVDIRYNVRIGSYTLINVDTIIQAATIGKFCSIGPRCQIGMPEHPTNHLSTSPFIYDKDRSILGIDSWEENKTPPVIGNDVWLGSNVIVLQGITIGDGAIVAAGAVVAKDVEPYTIVGGVPAKFIKNRFEDEVIAKLLKWKWWDLPAVQLKKHKDKFEAGSDWLKNYSVD